MAARSPEAVVELAAIEDDLSGMDCLDGVEGNGEIARVLDVHHETVRRDFAIGAELLSTVGHERLVPDLDPLSHVDPPTSRLRFAPSIPHSRLMDHRGGRPGPGLEIEGRYRS